MTGALMPEYWAEAEQTTARPRWAVMRWFSPSDRAAGNALDPAKPDRLPEKGPGLVTKEKGYLADIW
jgi:hypothetical protein